jgi:hypothetical protein
MRARGLVLLLVVAGCGDPLVTDNYKPPYFSITAKFDDSMLSPSQHAALPQHPPTAILWSSNTKAGSAYAAQLVSSQLDRLADVRLDIYSLPEGPAVFGVSPGLASRGLDPRMHYAFGTLIAYIDGNNNNQLDMVDSLDSKSPDTIVAATNRIGVYDLTAGRPAPLEFMGIFPTENGFSLIEEPVYIDPPIGSCDEFDVRGRYTYHQCYAKAVGNAVVLPAIATVPLTLLADDPQLQRYACTSFLGPSEFSDWYGQTDEIQDSPSAKFCGGQTCLPDLPPPGMCVECNPDNSAYRFKVCHTDKCGTIFCHFGHWARLPGTPAPSWWPTCCS